MWYRKTGHSVTIEDVKDILEANPDYLIIGKGVSGFMRVDNTLKRKLKALHIELIAERTPNAAKTFNKILANGHNVAAGFHLTC